MFFTLIDHAGFESATYVLDFVHTAVESARELEKRASTT